MFLKILKLKKNYSIKIFSSILILFCFFYFLNNFNNDNNYTIPMIKSKELNNDNNNNPCLSEWTILNQDIYFRRNLAFYYTDLKVIRLYFERKTLSKHNLTLIYSNIYINKQQIIQLNQTNKKEIQKDNNYSFEYIDFNFNLAATIVDKTLFKVIVKLKNDETESIDLTIKAYRNKDDSQKNHSMLCSKVYYFSNDYYSTFKWWIEMNKIHGYKKLVIYNNSIENSNKFSQLFEHNKYFVELIQFKCIPNFMDENNSNLTFISSFYDFQTKYNKPILDVHVHFEQVVFNECYLQNMNKYKYITINDQDETIIPTYLKNYKQQENGLIKSEKSFMKIAESFCYYNKNEKETNIQVYLNSLQTASDNHPVTFHFNMGVYMKQTTMDLIFDQIDKLTNFSTSSIRIYDKNELNYYKQILDFNITINSIQDYEYAKYLYDVYKTVLKPFYMKNKDKLKQIPESYNRLFYLLGPSTTWFCGKTIHNTLITESLTTHYPQSFDSVTTIPIEQGFSSHFRKDYNLNWNEKSIKEFRFDLNYFLCYYKPILNKF